MTDAAVKDAFINMDMDENKNIFTSYPAEADRHVSFLTAFEDEVMGAEHAFLGHECDKDLVGGHLGFGTYDLQKCFSVGNISSALEYDEIINGDAVNSTLNVGEEAEKEFFNGMLQGTDERILREHNLRRHASNEHSLDTRVMGGHFNNTYSKSEKSCLRENLELENGAQALGRADREADMSGLASEKACIELRNGKNSALFDQMTVQELQETFRVMFGRETMVEDKHWLKRRLLFGLENNSELEEHLNLVRCRTAFNENEVKKAPTSSCTQDGGSLVEEKPKGIVTNSLATLSSELAETGTSSQDKGDEGLVIIGKRLHKPPRRYIEESLEPKSRSSSRRRCATIQKALKVKPLGVKSPKQPSKQPPKQLPRKGNGAVLSVHEEEPFNGACIQVPFGLPVEEEQVKETPSSLTLSIVSCHDSDNCPSNQSTISNERSDAECLSVSAKLQENISKTDREARTNVQKGKRRRKHHMPWTQSEVLKLIEGISHLGVGRWSKIKKLLFASSKHRTSVDLKDKWRNLVKASCTQLRKKRKGVQGRKQLTHQAPEPVLRRVRELANLYS
ncbi:uncharacterized protein LOC116210005 isoform X1 [Punica granatum]|uniref:Uncharacterized protein LOC116210005 isoform X1 n=2 Tax=Punica granatum TaxID=22663 RepID=A0A218W996_PUNGR|nr:uncharacterized protein LOC116210005 isoform X1 [Punica granatum]XP_031399643.1 uncharacterized protein LOC116210005 isoform X1 [Punica granatum]XP_031399644.1 uncharacterized protein LOC116210005 isoform X1 [Punica granatum]OWM68910.1 hypothetical protein CDL15_Pgr025097 [Punica granatum]